MLFSKALEKSVKFSWILAFQISPQTPTLDRKRFGSVFGVFGTKSAGCHSAKMASSKTAPAKPPNIVVFGEGQRDEIRRTLSAVLNPDRYVFLNLNAVQIVDEPWQDNAELVVLGRIPQEILPALRQHWKDGGKILALCSNSAEKFVGAERVPVVHRSHGETNLPLGGDAVDFSLERSLEEKIAVDKNTNSTVIGAIRGEKTEGLVVFSRVSFTEEIDTSESLWKKLVLREILSDFFHLDCSRDQTVGQQMGPCYVYAKTPTTLKTFVSSLQPHLRNGRFHCPRVSLRVAGSDPSSKTDAVTEIPLIVDPVSHPSSSFSPELYYRYLKAQTFGHVVWYSEVVTSTMDLLDSCNIPPGVVCVAGRQTGGKGRGGHVWLSPEGCAMFSLQVSVPIDSKLGQRIPFVQHLASLAIVDGIRSIPGYEDVDLRLKWPNDIYYGDSVKLGGVIVQSTVMSDTIHCTVGCGVNVSNEKPTVCLDDVIMTANPKLARLSREQVIAAAVSKLEEFIRQFQKCGTAELLPKYYSWWLHGGTKIKVVTPDGSARPASIEGLDDYGFLQVRADDSGMTFSVQPDGNSFDMLHNLLMVREGGSGV